MIRTGAEAEHGVVLVAAGDPARARQLVDCLSRAGHDVICTSDAGDAERSALRRDPDLTIIDLKGMGVESRDVAARLHSHRRLRRMPIVHSAGGTFDAVTIGAHVRSIVSAA